MRAKKARTEIRRDQIARAALELMVRHGWKQVSLQAVARKVGVVPSNIYRHYRNKDQIVDAVLDLVEHRFSSNVRAVSEESSDAMERLRRLLTRHVQLVRGEIPVPRVVFSEETFAGNPRRRRRVYAIFKNYLHGIAGIILDGQDHGRIGREQPAETLAVMFLGLVQPSAILWVMSAGEFDLEGQTEAAWRVFAAAIQPKAPATIYEHENKIVSQAVVEPD